MPLRQYSSQQAMRPVDGLRQPAPKEPPMNHAPNSQSNGVYNKIFPPIGVHDFQEFPTRRPNTASAKQISRTRYDSPSAPPPMPNYQQPSMQSTETPRLAFTFPVLVIIF